MSEKMLSSCGDVVDLVLSVQVKLKITLGQSTEHAVNSFPWGL